MITGIAILSPHNFPVMSFGSFGDLRFRELDGENYARELYSTKCMWKNRRENA